MGWFDNDDDRRDRRRAFTQSQKASILYQQNNLCARCHQPLDPRAIEFDHHKPWADSGRTVTWNGRALCANCHKIVTHEHTLTKVQGKAPRVADPEIGAVKAKLETLKISQLKFLARSKNMKVKGTVEEGLFEDTVHGPSKKQFVKALSKVYKSDEIDQTLAKIPPPAPKKKKKKSSSWW